MGLLDRMYSFSRIFIATLKNKKTYRKLLLKLSFLSWSANQKYIYSEQHNVVTENSYDDYWVELLKQNKPIPRIYFSVGAPWYKMQRI